MTPVPDGEVNVDIDRATGTTIWGWPVVEQSISELILTQAESRVLREYIGSRAVAALGRNLNEETVLRVYTAIAMILDVYEPRYRITQFRPAVSEGRSGRLSLHMQGKYLPRALLGDMTEESALRGVEVVPIPAAPPPSVYEDGVYEEQVFR